MLRLLTTWVTPKSVGAEGVEGAIGKPLLASAEAKSPA